MLSGRKYLTVHIDFVKIQSLGLMDAADHRTVAEGAGNQAVPKTRTAPAFFADCKKKFIDVVALLFLFLALFQCFPAGLPARIQAQAPLSFISENRLEMVFESVPVNGLFFIIIKKSPIQPASLGVSSPIPPWVRSLKKGMRER